MKLSNNPYRSSKITLPYVCVSDYFTDDELNQIEFLSKLKPLHRATIVSQENGLVIQDAPIRVSNNSFHGYSEENSWFFEKLNSAIESINEKKEIPTEKEIEDLFLFELVAGYRGLKDDKGNELEYNETNTKVLLDIPYIRNLIEDASANMGNFSEK